MDAWVGDAEKLDIGIDKTLVPSNKIRRALRRSRRILRRSQKASSDRTTADIKGLEADGRIVQEVLRILLARASPAPAARA